MKKTHSFLLILSLVFTTLFSSENELTLSSTERKTSLLELYTSEGCSSCPTADQWFSKLKQSENLWKNFVPVAFHVDYWNKLGWVDRFSSSVYTQRQHEYSDIWKSDYIYTPEFVLNAREWRLWKNNSEPAITDTSHTGVLKVTITQDELTIKFSPLIKVPKTLDLRIACLGFDLSSQVSRGENSGKTLKHDFAILHYHETTIKRTDSGYEKHLSVNDLNLDEYGGIAVWVSNPRNMEPLQAVGGWLKK